MRLARIVSPMPDPTRTAVGTWSGGRFMKFGEPLDDDRMVALLRPDDRIRTVLTADAYGQGEADRLLGRALDGVPRDAYCLTGAIGHDFYEGELERDDWIVEPAHPDDVFADEPDELWSDVLERKGGQYALVARMPLDPSLN